MTTSEILEKLCTSPGVSGMEKETAATIRNILAPFCSEFSVSPLGSLSATLNSGKDKKIMLMAHMDKIGLRITSIDKESGFLRISPSGNVDARVLAAARVLVFGKKTLQGTIISVPPHLANPEAAGKAVSVKDSAIDCLLPYDEIVKYIEVGDSAQLYFPFTQLSENRFTSPFIDNSAGCTAVIKAIEKISKRLCNYTVTAVFSTREETGRQGAATSAFSSGAKEAIITDVSFGTAPGISEECSSPLGSGAMICRSPVIQDGMSKELIDIAEKNNIKYTLEIAGRTTGTDADTVVTAAGGIRTGLISVPLRNMHTPTEVVDIRDIESVSELMAEFVLREAE